jgi:hypothetical protein
MLKRIVLGPLKGGVIGALVAAALIWGLKLSALTGALSYLAVTGCGFVCGIVAGKPVWAASAKTEALLKALAGGGMAAAILFVLRRFVKNEVELGPIGSGKLLELPLLVLPAVGAILALLFEIDDAVGRAHETPQRPK